MRPGAFRNRGGIDPIIMEKKILLVHQSELVRDVLTATLKVEGHKVTAVPDALEAIKAISLERPALMVLELNLPDRTAHLGGVAWDNFLVIAWAGRFGAKGAIPFIALGGKNGDLDRDRALELGAVDFLPGRLETHQLVRAVGRAFELARLY
jgi:CheY-like chemotaxis protein